MQTLSYGFKKPQNPDTGDVFFPALETNWQQVNDHTHDGVTSAPLSSAVQNALAANWVATAGGTYRQLMTVPAGLQFDSCQIWVRRSTGEYAYPTLERVSATTFYIYTNDNTLAYKVLYR